MAVLIPSFLNQNPVTKRLRIAKSQCGGWWLLNWKIKEGHTAKSGHGRHDSYSLCRPGLDYRYRASVLGHYTSVSIIASILMSSTQLKVIIASHHSKSVDQGGLGKSERSGRDQGGKQYPPNRGQDRSAWLVVVHALDQGYSLIVRDCRFAHLAAVKQVQKGLS